MEKDAYDVLMERLGFPGSVYLRRILQYLMTPEQSKVAAELPGSVEEVSQKAGIPVEKVKEILDELFRKGVTFPKDFDKRDYFRFARDIIQLHDATLATKQLDPEKDKEYFKLWHDFGVHESYKKLGEIFSSLGKPFFRIVPAYNAIKDLPDVLPCENIRELFKAQDFIAVVPCSCRMVKVGIGEKCDHTEELKVWHCIQVGRGAEYVVKRGSGVKLSLEEIFKILDEAEKDGLIHTWPNTAAMKGAGVYTMCNCCGDCCEFFLSSRAAKIPLSSMIEKSRYVAYTNLEKCTGCQTCIERCSFDAIELVKPEGSKKYKAQVNAEKCFGCGVCVVGCPQEAIKMKVVRPPEHIPGISQKA